MPLITRLMLQNFKKFPELDVSFCADRNVLIGDNESGKSTILLALDLVLSDSRHRVEALGVESLLSLSAVKRFLEGERRADLLPVLTADVFLSEGEDPGLNGRQNLTGMDADGLRMRIAPMIEEYGQDIHHVLQQDPDNFPYEYYAVRFSTFSGGHFAGFRRYLRHLLLDSARIDNDYAAQEYTRTVYNVNVPVADRYRLENSYRQQKMHFCAQHLSAVNNTLETYQFGVRSGTKSGLEANLDITEDGISFRHRGKGRQCFIKTEFALQRHQRQGELHALLLEEPENHLSHVSMKRLVNQLATERQTQVFIATHSSHISSRLDLRKAILLGATRPVLMNELSAETAAFFMKAPDNNVLEFTLAKRVLLVEGDAEFILIEAFYRRLYGRAPEDEGVHIIAIGGTSFRRYLELARLLENRVAVLRDNDGSYQQNCDERYADVLCARSRVFADRDDRRSTFEISLYQDNTDLCDALFSGSRRTLTVQDYMLANKAEAAFLLLQLHGEDLSVPDYIQEALAWIRE
ncbi:AAA family ATPase [Atlantibacter hermannii]|uniref:ATP-dependent nuclease n=1 Tax=Atlantibacter hermannii TaxID=565 RepID=UPI001C708114|nr:TOPRIM nucleotidyl transferase/hydrolase domain-containing protein [Atlantibacter hermannii]MBW9429162.1 AAA family ATPase [Atlantibacter hermannii]